MPASPTRATRARGDATPPLSEAVFQKRVIEAARLYGWLVFHPLPARNSRGGWRTFTQGDTGFPDLVLARRGVVMVRELKTDRGQVSPEQKRWIAQLGQHVAVWRPRDWDAIRVELRDGPPPVTAAA